MNRSRRRTPTFGHTTARSEDLETDAFIERFAGCLDEDFPDDIDEIDLASDAPREPLE